MANMALLGPDHYPWLTLGGFLKVYLDHKWKYFLPLQLN